MRNIDTQNLLEEAEKRDECAKKFSNFPFPIVEGLVEADMGDVVPGYSLYDYLQAEKVEESKKNKKEENKPEKAQANTVKKKYQYTKKFEADFKKVLKQPKAVKMNLAKVFDDCVDTLCNNRQLDAKFKLHKMPHTSKKDWGGCFDFHLAPDIVVIYSVEGDMITFLRMGSHNELELT